MGYWDFLKVSVLNELFSMNVFVTIGNVGGHVATRVVALQVAATAMNQKIIKHPLKFCILIGGVPPDELVGWVSTPYIKFRPILDDDIDLGYALDDT